MVNNSTILTIPCKIATSAANNLLADTTQIWDSNLNKFLNEINLQITGTSIISLSSINRTKNDRLYEVTYNSYSKEKALKFFGDGGSNIVTPACSSVRSGNFYGRNLDWLYDNSVEFLVRTPHTSNANAVIGIASCISSMTQDIVEDVCEHNTYNETMEIIPWALVDGINEHGVICSVNVVVASDKEGTERTVPTVSKEDSIYSGMVVRYILDNFSTAYDAVEYLKEHVEIITSKKMLNVGFTDHFMVADKNNTYIIECLNNGIEIIDEQHILTNFWISGVTFNPEGTVFTNKDVPDGHSPREENHITDFGQGLERYNNIVGYSGTNLASMRQLMNSLWFSNAYTEPITQNTWFSDFTGEGFTVDTPSSDPEFVDFILVHINKFRNRSRNQQSPYFGVWHTVHSVIYNIDKKLLHIITQDADDLATHEEQTYSLFQEKYELPVATRSSLGGVIVSTGLSITTDGRLTANGVDIDIDSELDNTSGNPVENKAIAAALNNKVDKDGNKVLSDNNYTDAARIKLAGIVSGANKSQIKTHGSGTGKYLQINDSLHVSELGTDSNPVYSAINANIAQTATWANSATSDSDGNNIVQTYVKKNEDDDVVFSGIVDIAGDISVENGNLLMYAPNVNILTTGAATTLQNVLNSVDQKISTIENRNVSFSGNVTIDSSKLQIENIKDSQLATASSTVKGGVKVLPNNTTNTKGIVIENDGTIGIGLNLDAEYEEDYVTVYAESKSGDVLRGMTCDINAATESSAGVMTAQHVQDLNTTKSGVQTLNATVLQISALMGTAVENVKDNILNSFDNLCKYLRSLGIAELQNIECFRKGDGSGDVDFRHYEGTITIDSDPAGDIIFTGIDEQYNITLSLTYSPSTIEELVNNIEYNISLDADWLEVTESELNLFTFSITTGEEPVSGSVCNCVIEAMAKDSNGNVLAVGLILIGVEYDG